MLVFHILRKLNKARENMANSENEFSAHDGLCRKRFGETTVEEWEQADTEPFKNASGQWESVYRRKTELGTCQKLLNIFVTNLYS